MNSFLVPCQVTHERYSQAAHHFRYSLYTFLLDVDELPALSSALRLFRHNGLGLASLLDADYLTEGAGSIREKLTYLLGDEGIDVLPTDTIYLITSPRILYYAFNPVSFYWVFRAGRLHACIAEVNNTFGEKHVYPLAGGGEDKQTTNTDVFPARYSAHKAFHVSPFFTRKGEYHFSFSDIRSSLAVTVALHHEGGKQFEASLTEAGPRQPLTDRNLLKALLTRPLNNYLTMPRILWEAARIHYGKKIGFTSKPDPVSHMTIRTQNTMNIFQRSAAAVVKRMLRRMPEGSFVFTEPDGSVLTYGQGALPYAGQPVATEDIEQKGAEDSAGASQGTHDAGLGLPEGVHESAALQVRSPRFFPQVVLYGDIGLGETYSKGLWDSPDLVQLFSYFLKNRQKQQSRLPYVLEVLLARAAGVVEHAVHQLAPPNDETGVRENIAAHYDLSNALFSSFLDSTMTYSSAVFADLHDEHEELAAAQQRKNSMLADSIAIRPEDHVLEIGCGWGGFAEQIAREYGCRVTGVTVSEQQYNYAKKRISDAGLDDQVTILLMDYRRLTDTYDKIVSIEMLEAVGHDFHAEYFMRIEALLKEGGRAAIQTITMQDARYDKYRWSMDWIRKHIFPGGLLPSLSRIFTVISRKTGLSVERVEAIGPHYARTLRHWRETFERNWSTIEPLGFDTYFRRTWRYYMAICEAGFAQGYIDNIQLVLAKQPVVPLKRV